MTTETVADLNPKTYDSAQRTFVEMWGGALRSANHFKWTSAVLAVFVLALLGLNFQLQTQAAHVKPLVIRIDQVGRAEAVAYDAATWKPQTPELRYFLTQFVKLHYGRSRQTIGRDYPASLLFLDGSLSGSLMAPGPAAAVEKFAAGRSDDEIDVEVSNVSFTELKAAPYHAAVDFAKHYRIANTRQERKTETFTAQLDFTLLDSVPNAYIPVNPLGLQITHVDVAQAFQ